MNRPIIISMFCCLLFANSVQSQTILEKINAIKSQGEIYLYGEFTHPDENTAVEFATKVVLNQVNDGKDGPETLERLKPYAKNIKMKRGTLTRAFVYVKKSELPILYGVRQDTKKLQEPEKVITKVEEAPAPVAKAFVPDIFIQQIQQQKTFKNVYKFLSEEKQQGRVLQFGALKDVEDYSSFDLILFDLNSQELVTVLSAVTQGGNRINQTNGSIDSLDNYPEDMVAVIWYIK